VTGSEAVALLRRHDALLREAADALRAAPDDVVAAIGRLGEQARGAAKAAASGATAAVDADALVAGAAEVAGARVVTEVVEVDGAKTLLDVADRVKARLGDEAAVVLGTAVEGRVHLVAAVAPGLVARGVRAGEVVKVAAQVTGGGGGGRDTMAQAGGRDPQKLPEALAAARAAIEASLRA
jgi:alanyl-tRNA synthetase